MFAPRDQAGAEHPGGHGTPPAQPARGPRHPHPTAHLGKLGGSEGERQSDEQSGRSTTPPASEMSPGRTPGRLRAGKPLAIPWANACCRGAGNGVYRVQGGGFWGVLPAMQLAPGSTAGLSPLQGSLRRGVHGHVTHGIGGPAPRVPHAPPSCCARGAREGGGGFYYGGFYQRLCVVAAAAAISPTPGGLQAAGGHWGWGGRGELPTSNGHAKACPGWGANSRQGKTLVHPEGAWWVGVHACMCMHRGTRVSVHTWGCTRVFPQPAGICSKCKDTRPWGLCRCRCPFRSTLVPLAALAGPPEPPQHTPAAPGWGSGCWQRAGAA